MAYNNIISRTDAAALIPEEVSLDILNTLESESAAMQLFRSINMGTRQDRLPILSALPVAGFINGDTGLVSTTEVNWANKFLTAEPLGCIVPIPRDVLADTSYDMWGNIKPLVKQAIGRALDAAVFFGVNKPSSFPGAIITGITTLVNTVERGTNTAAQGGLAQDINDVMSLVEAQGFRVTGFTADEPLRGRLRGARDTQGRRLDDITPTEIEGKKIVYSMDGLWPTAAGSAELIAGDFRQAILGYRTDISYTLLKESVIQDATGAIQYNLAQQRMVALLVEARFGFQVANNINYRVQSEASRYPFAALVSPTP